MDDDGELKQQCDSVSTCSQAVEVARRALISAGIESAALESQLLVSMAQGVDRISVAANTAPNLTRHQKSELFRLITKRVRRVPLAYLRGSQEFYGLPFTVTPETLIPRPETELLVDFARDRLGAVSNEISPVFIDVGTGSGCIAISVLRHVADARAIGVDLSGDALQVARQNAMDLTVSDRIRLANSDALDAVRGRVRLVISNPPYIPTSDIGGLQPEVADSEPRLALDGGADGMDIIRKLAASANRVLQQDGWLAVECAAGQAGHVASMYKAANLSSIGVERDLAGIERIVFGQCKLVS